MTVNKIRGEKFGHFFNEKYELACALLDCEAFKSWHTPSRSEWGEVLTAINKMVRKYEWPAYEVTRDGDDVASMHVTNTGLMLNAVHNLLVAFNCYSTASVLSPGQWGDIMRVVDETTERRALVDQAGKP